MNEGYDGNNAPKRIPISESDRFYPFTPGNGFAEQLGGAQRIFDVLWNTVRDDFAYYQTPEEADEQRQQANEAQDAKFQ